MREDHLVEGVILVVLLIHLEVVQELVGLLEEVVMKEEQHYHQEVEGLVQEVRPLVVHREEP